METKSKIQMVDKV